MKGPTTTTTVDVNLHKAGFRPDLSETSGINLHYLEPIYYGFQIINGLGALGLVLDPRATHERMMKKPQEAYTLLGFSGTALDMLNNVLRGHGAALLAITVAAAEMGPRNRDTYGLIASTCLFSAVANIFTANHHRNNSLVMSAIEDLTPLYGLIGLNTILGGAALAVYLQWMS